MRAVIGSGKRQKPKGFWQFKRSELEKPKMGVLKSAEREREREREEEGQGEKMEEMIAKFSKSAGSFCNHLQSSCEALKQSVDRRPIPLDSASSTFIQSLNRRVSSASADLNLLESMAFGTVSFEELLGHCNEVYKKNQSDLLDLEDRLKNFGYIPEVEIEDEGEDCAVSAPQKPDFNFGAGAEAAGTSLKTSLEEDDPLMDGSFSLKKFGISDVGLATLASGADAKFDEPVMCLGETVKYNDDALRGIRSTDMTAPEAFGVIKGETGVGVQKIAEAPTPIVKVSKDDFESLPSYIKNLTSWEDLLDAVEKINSSLRKKDGTKGSNYFHQDEIESLGLGPKARTYLLLLTRLHQLVVETIDGLISYKVV